MIRAFATASMVVVLARTAQPAPGERDERDACKAMIERAAQSQQPGAAPDDAAACKNAGRSSRNGPCGIPG
jgi:hypothetical protein